MSDCTEDAVPYCVNDWERMAAIRAEFGELQSLYDGETGEGLGMYLTAKGCEITYGGDDYMTVAYPRDSYVSQYVWRQGHWETTYALKAD